MIAIFNDINFIANLAILFFLVITAIGIIRSKSLLTGTILLSIFSLFMASEYLLLGAPDVAITEAAVGAGISTILILLGLFLVGDKEKKSTRSTLLPFLLIVAVASALIYTTLQLPHFGKSDNPASGGIAVHYLQNGEAETGITNTVSSILTSYRGYDTLGETMVIFAGGIAVLLLLGRRRVLQKKD